MSCWPWALPCCLWEVQKTKDILSRHHSLLLDLEASHLNRLENDTGAAFRGLLNVVSLLPLHAQDTHTYTYLHTAFLCLCRKHDSQEWQSRKSGRGQPGCGGASGEVWFLKAECQPRGTRHQRPLSLTLLSREQGWGKSVPVVCWVVLNGISSSFDAEQKENPSVRALMFKNTSEHWEGITIFQTPNTNKLLKIIYSRK